MRSLWFDQVVADGDPLTPRPVFAREAPPPGESTTWSQASVRTDLSTSWISSNCGESEISGGASWITGSPRSSARQISPRS